MIKTQQLGKFAMVVSAMALFAASASAAPLAPDYGYLFDDNTSPASADWGTHDGSAGSGVTWDGTSKKFGAGSLAFDGSADALVTLGSLSNDLQGLSAFTISVWVYASVFDQDHGIFTGDSAEFDDQNLQFRFDKSGWVGKADNTLKFGLTSTVQTNGAGYEGYSNVGKVGVWQHVAYTWSSGNAPVVYVDGSPITFKVSDGAVSGTLTDLNGKIAALGVGGKDDYWNGYMDEFAVWTSELSAEDVSWLSQNSLSAIPEPGTLALIALGSAAVMLRRRRA